MRVLHGRRFTQVCYVLILISASGTALAAGGGKAKRLCPPCPCPCPEPTLEIAPEAPAEPRPPAEQPIAPETMPDTTAAINDALAGSYDVAASSDFTAPNMFGDLFGGGLVKMSIPQAPLIIQPPGSAVLVVNDSQFIGGTADFPGNVVIGPGTLLVSVDGNPAPSLAIGSGTTFVSTGVIGLVPGGQLLSIAENNGVTAGVNTIVEGVRGLAGSLQNFQGVVEQEFTNEFVSIAIDYDFIPNPIIIPRRNILLLVPNPADGGVVGRTKISEDNNPLPRDRFIFNYDYFNNVPLTANGWNVSRFSPGFEKTFFNRMTSVEVRFPFASTLDSAITQGLETSNVEFGDIHMTFKALLLAGQTCNVAAGMGLSIPTANDVSVRLPNGNDLVRVQNEAVILTPYLAGLWTPNPRLFAQAWTQFSFDANGSPVLINPIGLGLVDVGRLSGQTLMQLDGQLGYWIVSRPQARGCTLAGLAPFVELHYNTTLNDPDAINTDGVTIGSLGGRVDELNLTAGVAAQFGNNLLMNVGAVAPLRKDFDRVFDYQIGVRASYFFGPTARARDWATRISNF